MCSFFLRAAAVAFLVLGVSRLALSRPAGWIVLAVLLLPGPLVYAMSRARTIISTNGICSSRLSGFVGFAALGVDWVAAVARTR